jgi:hypothetical protein
MKMETRWTFSDDDHEGVEVNQLATQPIINYNLSLGWSINFVPIWTANWDAASDQTWTIPLGLGVSKITTIGSQHVSLGVQYTTTSRAARKHVRESGSFQRPAALPGETARGCNGRMAARTPDPSEGAVPSTGKSSTPGHQFGAVGSRTKNTAPPDG